MTDLNSIYAAEIADKPKFPAPTGNLDCEIAIIGGGFTGMTAALTLAENGHDVVLVEADVIGSGGSGRNGGHVCQGWPNDFHHIQRQLSEQDAQIAWDSGMAAIDLVKDRVKKYKIDCDLTFGYVDAAYHRRQMAGLDEMQREWEARGYEGFTRLNDRTALAAHIDTNAYVGGLFDSKSGHMQPLKYLHGLAAAAKSQGAVIFENTPITKVDVHASGGHKHLHTKNGQQVRAKILLLCGNAYLADVGLPIMKSRLAQVTSSVLATKPLSTNMAKQLLPTGAAVADCNAALNYYRIDAKGRMIFGGRASYLNTDPLNVEADLKNRMKAVFPNLMHKKIMQAWSGRIGITVNRLPDFGRVSDTAIYVQGYSGHGVAFSGVAAHILSEAATGNNKRFNQLIKVPHMPFPGGPLRTPILALGMGWYKMKDYFQV